MQKAGLCVCAAGFEGQISSLLAQQGNITIGQVTTAAELSVGAWVKKSPAPRPHNVMSNGLSLCTCLSPTPSVRGGEKFAIDGPF